MRAKKSLGQNFLRDESVIRRIVDALDLGVQDTVIEIGPGRGALTERLLATGANVLAIEIDREFVPALRVQFHSEEKFQVVEADVLDTDFAKLLTIADAATTKLVGNLPYNISTPILQRLIDQRDLFSKIVLMFQREVVERITAPPGGKQRGYLSVLVENSFDTEHLFDVSPETFQPVPKVWSAVAKLTPKESVVPDEPLFRKIVSASFAQKRKTILNNLKPVFHDAARILSESSIDAKKRAEALTLDEWKLLTDAVRRSSSAAAEKPSA